jgi:hypothetical protein
LKGGGRGKRFAGHLLPGRRGGRGGGWAATPQDVEADVAAALDTLVVLLGQDSTDEAQEAVAVGEHPDDVDATTNLSVETFMGLLDQIWGRI